ncbi:MAG: hypothetical protein MZV70_67165 [Desulfobacterales bacterium]|nr:hypothetical protein [Desulfobacterales bacterium]
MSQSATTADQAYAALVMVNSRNRLRRQGTRNSSSSPSDVLDAGVAACVKDVAKASMPAGKWGTSPRRRS